MPGPFPLDRLAPTIDEHGINVVAFEDILASYLASFRQIYGMDLYLEPDTSDGQWLSIMAQAVNDLGQAIAQAYFSYSPSFARGVGLSSVVKINGLQRQIPTRSSAQLVIVGEAHTTIPAGVVSDGVGNLWDLPPEVTIPASGEITVNAIAREPGQTLAPAGSLTIIVNPQPGWQTVTNPATAVPGAPVETDAQLRLRQHRSTSLPAVTPIGGIYGTLANLPGAGRVQVYENDQSFVNAIGIPPHSISAVLDGGDPVQIADAIMRKKAPGTGTYGSTSVDVRDQMAMPVTVNFFFTERIEIFIEITIIPRQGFAAPTANMIRQAVTLFVNEQLPGWPLYRAWIAAPASLAGDVAQEATGLSQFELHRLAETYVLAQIRIGTVGGPLATEDIQLRFFETAVTVPTDVGVVVQE
ncbi:MAG: baseplate J/gp47 family protein [Alphaproteobacteria bacterium]|nr:baseplate J/gp47 family protein [Alphaproteobacteria bacterium]